MSSVRSLVAILCALFLVHCVAPAQAQGKGKFLVPIPEKLERETKADESGVLQWVEFKAGRCVNCNGQKTMDCLHCERLDPKDHENCPECKLTKKATCRICGGTGDAWDILTKAPCPTCFGAGITRCFICGGAGRFPVQGGGGKPAKCGSCDATGAYKCATCDGKRFVETLPLKPSMAEGKAADLKKAIEALTATLAAVTAFQSTGDGRKDIKEYDKAISAGAKVFPALKRAGKHFEDVTKKQSKGSVWQQYADMVKNQAADAKQALEYFCKHQKRVLELCLARAEHNEPLLAPKKK